MSGGIPQEPVVSESTPQESITAEDQPQKRTFRKPTPRDDIPRELRRCQMATEMLEDPWGWSRDIEDPDNDEEFQRVLNRKFKFSEDVAEYEAKYGPVMGLSYEEKFKEIKEQDRENFMKYKGYYMDPAKVEEELDEWTYWRVVPILRKAEEKAQREIMWEKGEKPEWMEGKVEGIDYVVMEGPTNKDSDEESVDWEEDDQVCSCARYEENPERWMESHKEWKHYRIGNDGEVSLICS